MFGVIVDYFFHFKIPNTGDECCGPSKKCDPKTPESCAPLPEPRHEDCGQDMKQNVIKSPGLCPQLACTCIEPEECPPLEKPDNSTLKPGKCTKINIKCKSSFKILKYKLKII